MNPEAVPGPLTLRESVDLLGRYRYVELALFRALGERSVAVAHPATARYLSAASGAHGWRARTIESLLPVSVGLPGTEECTRSPSAHLDAAVSLLVAPGPDAAVLGALVEVLYPAMLDAYRERLGVASPAADGPLTRALERCIGDLVTVLEEGRSLRGAEGSTALSAEVAALLDRSGGPFGPLLPLG